MKKLLSLLIMLMLSIALHAQHNVTKFLGIPVDGTKASMIQKLKNKGFTYNIKKDMLSGEFNGDRVNISVITYKNKVWRLAIYNRIACDETQIKIRFNTLCQQFKNNPNYRTTNITEIPVDEDISHELISNKKMYYGIAMQAPEKEGSEKRVVWFTIYEDYGKYELYIYYDNVYNHDTTNEL